MQRKANPQPQKSRQVQEQTKELKNLLMQRETTPSFLSKAFNCLEQGADPNETDNEGNTLLHLLIKITTIKANKEHYDYYSLINKLVLKFNAKVALENKQDQTPLQIALNGGSFANIFTLLDHGANPHTKSSLGYPILHCLILAINKYEVDFIRQRLNELIIRYNLDIQEKDNFGKTVLQLLLKALLLQKSPRHNLSFYRILLELLYLKADLNTKDEEGNSLLHILLSKQCIAAFDKLPTTFRIHDLRLMWVKNLIEHDEVIHSEGKERLMDAKNNQGITPRELVFQEPMHIDTVMCLIRLEKDLRVKGKLAKSVLCFLENSEDINSYVPEFTELKEIYFKFCALNRADFLNLTIILAADYCNPSSQSHLKLFPVELVAQFLSFLDIENMGVSSLDCYDLTCSVFGQFPMIKDMLKTPAGVNVFQFKDPASLDNRFAFYKSVYLLQSDYEAFQRKLAASRDQAEKDPILKKGLKVIVDTIVKLLIGNSTPCKEQIRVYRERYAFPCWESHSKALPKPEQRERLFEQIKDYELYAGSLRKMRESVHQFKFAFAKEQTIKALMNEFVKNDAKKENASEKGEPSQNFQP